MKTYCDAYAKVPATATAAQLAAFQNSDTISGVSAPDSSTLMIKLGQPASDFLNIIAALGFAYARPVEYDSYLPDSPQFRQHTLSDGPYAISSYTATKQVVFKKNPAWTQLSDPVRHQYVNEIVINEGLTSATALSRSRGRVRRPDVGHCRTRPRSRPWKPARTPTSANYGGQENPYLVFDFQPCRTNSLAVRQAIEYAINKVAIAKIYGGTKLNPILNGAIAPGNVGYTNYNYYPSPNSEGDPAKCKHCSPAGRTRTASPSPTAYRNAGNHPAVFTSVQSDLKACGITVKGSPQQQGPYYAFIENAANSAKADQWDITEPGWVPDWAGNNARSNVVPLFQTNCTNPTTNEGCYSNATTDNLIKQALAAPNEAAAAPLWAKAGQQVMKDAAIVPFTTQDVVLCAGTHVHNLIYNPLAEQYNVTQLWLSPRSSPSGRTASCPFYRMGVPTDCA